MHDFLHLDRYAVILEDPKRYFVDLFHQVPRIVEHATGRPCHVITKTGHLRPYVDYLAGKIPAADLPRHVPQPHDYDFGPVPPRAEAEGVAAESTPGTFAFGVEVTNP